MEAIHNESMLSMCGGNSLFPIALSDCRWAIHLWEIGVREAWCLPFILVREVFLSWEVK